MDIVQLWAEKKRKLITIYIKSNLERMGHTFDTEQQMIDFCKSRVTNIICGETEHQLYLDYVSPRAKGRFIGSYSSGAKVKIEFNTIHELNN